MTMVHTKQNQHKPAYTYVSMQYMYTSVHSSHQRVNHFFKSKLGKTYLKSCPFCSISYEISG